MWNNQLFNGALLIGLVASLWSKLKLIAYKIINLLIVTTEIDSEICNALYIYLNDSEQWKKTPFCTKNFYTYQTFVRPLNKEYTVIAESTPQDVLVFFNRFKPIVLCGPDKYNYGMEGGGSYETKRQYIYHIRGTIDIEDILVQSIDYYRARIDGESKEMHKYKVHTKIDHKKNIHVKDFVTYKPKVKRYFIQKFVGSGGGMARLAVAQNGNKPSAVSTNKTYAKNLINRHLKWSLEELGEPLKEGEALDFLATSPELDNSIKKLIRWKNSEEWYKERGLRWQWGWLLHGKPGCGKTLTVTVLAQDLDMPVFVFDLASMSNRELMEYWDEMRRNTPCIALIEDIDTVFNGRNYIVGDQGGGLTFDCLLNTINGVEANNGIFTVVTTNDISKIDPAMGINSEYGSTRPGRLDEVIELTPLNEEGRYKLTRIVLKGYDDLIDGAVRDGNGMTGAQFINYISGIALGKFWEGA
jgi:hypothetical protein